MAVKSKKKETFDFGGWATVYNVKCTDGRTILPNAFGHMDGKKIPMVWQHLHDDPSNILGHGILKHANGKGVYVEAFFNDTDAAQNAKKLVVHGDIDALSIYANQVKEIDKAVSKANLKEFSLVVGGANKDAVIDTVNIVHSDGSEDEMEGSYVIYSGVPLEVAGIEHTDDDEDDDEFEHEDGAENAKGKTVKQVMDSMTPEQKNVLNFLVGKALEESGSIKQDDEDDEDDNEGEAGMKKNVFDKSENEEAVISHSDMKNVFETWKQVGSMEKAMAAHDITEDKLRASFAHAGTTYGVHSDSIGYLFPDAKSLTTPPTLYGRDMGWVSGVMNGVKKTPFSRIKSLYADLTPDAVRAKGYVTGNLKVEEVFQVLTRATTPTTVYKKQKMDRDDVLDITEFNVILWLKMEMQLMLKEELARAILVSDGRTLPDDDKISETNIRPIYQDDHIYSHKHTLEVTVTDWDDIIDEIITARKEYKGKGQPTMYCTADTLTNMLLLKDTTGRYIYRSVDELARVLRVKEIVEVEVMEGVQRDNADPVFTADLLAILVNPSDYTVGADKGGQTAMFEDFDIDYNQQKYLIETRMSGALVNPKTALCIERKTA